MEHSLDLPKDMSVDFDLMDLVHDGKIRVSELLLMAQYPRDPIDQTPAPEDPENPSTLPSGVTNLVEL